MSDITARIADPEDLRVLIMFAAVLMAGALLCAGAWRAAAFGGIAATSVSALAGGGDERAASAPSRRCFTISTGPSGARC
jgi:hypothetical protein